MGWRSLWRAGAFAGCLALLALSLLTPSLRADVLHMKDGREIEGQVIEETKSLIKIRTLLGTFEFKTAEVDRIERGKSRLEDFEERMAAAKTGDDYHAVGEWAAKKRMRKQAKQAMRKAVEVEPMHAAANTWLGFVLHEGEWVTPEEREKRIAAAKEAAQEAKGLVRYGDRWVTPEDKRRLEQGLIEVDGQWMTFEESQRSKGLEEHDGRWIERTEALARGHASEAEDLTQVPFEIVVNREALLAGCVPISLLEDVAKGILVGRDWFNQEMRAEAGLELLAGRRAEFYLFDIRDEPFQSTVPYFADLTETLPEGWSEIAKKAYGFFWTDPYAMSSARQWHRGQKELVGHCYHHWGHMLLGRLGYDGRLLPPWYEESFASLMEFNIHQKNAVFCRARTTASTGTVSTRTKRVFDPKMVRDGKWREALKIGIRERQVHSIDKLYQLDFGDMEVLDIATGMGLIEWIDSHGPDALSKFHAIYRGDAPKSPARLVTPAQDRQRTNDKAFKVATGMNWREADRAWKAWFLQR